MQLLMLLLIVLATMLVAARLKTTLMGWTIGGAALLVVVTFAGLFEGWLTSLLWAVFLILLLPFHLHELRRRWLSEPLFHYMRKVLPQLSETERTAMEAGSIWWDAELFSGDPDWRRLHGLPAPMLSDEEQAFLDGPVEQLCAMLDDWDITHKRNDLPPEVWAFIKQHRFFAMIIPKAYGGLEFSAYAHSEVIQKVVSRNLAAAVTIMVPNSLGPAELLLNYGTEEQKQHYLPKLASGEEIPCFALTGPLAGSDAGAMPDRGVVCEGEYQGKKVLGFRVDWEKRYITLGPVATVLGLAFHAFDPDHLLGDTEDLGITCALIPTATKGVSIGRRHYPLDAAFQNGPNSGKDVFVPMAWVIGGEAQVGKGWRMLMERLAVGRGISLPSLSVGSAKLVSFSSGAYAAVRQQFGIAVGKFEGVEAALARIGGTTYLMDSARRLTLAGLDAGERPSVVTAIVKYYLTEGMRQVVNDAMDVHGGKGICMGPNNYLASAYQSVPIGITVEGANILTRTMIIFGQGAMRCHPFILRELETLAGETDEHIRAFDALLTDHVAHTLRNVCRSFVYGISNGYLAPSPAGGELAGYYRQLARFSAAFAALSDMALLVLGGALKRKEHLSGRFADALGNMYLCSAVLKRYAVDSAPAEDLPLVHWSCQTALCRVQEALYGIVRNFPFWPARLKMYGWAFPLGRRLKPPTDALEHKVASLMLEPSSSRQRLIDGLYLPDDPDDLLGGLEHALQLSLQAGPIEHRLRKAGERQPDGLDYEPWLQELLARDVIGKEEAELLTASHKAMLRVIAVDDFPAPRQGAPKETAAKEATPKRTPKRTAPKRTAS